MEEQMLHMADSRIPDFSTVKSPPPQPDLEYEMVSGGEVIGSGGQAIIKRVSLPDRDSPEVVAVKEPQVPAQTLNKSTVESFFQEARTWGTLAKREREQQFRDTDHIVGVVAIGDMIPWVAMEYMDGGSLADRLDSRPDGLPVDEALWIAECLCRGLKIAHDNGVAHLDLKPANILFRQTSNGRWNVPKIADWGLARSLLEDAGSVEALSFEYAAPEQLDSDQFGGPDTYTDIYQLGAIVYEMLTGCSPYAGGLGSVVHDVVHGADPDPPSTMREELPPEVDEAVLRALNTRRSQRYRAIELFEDRIQDIRDSVVTTVNKSTKPSQDWPMFRGGPAHPGHAVAETAGHDPASPHWQFGTDGDVSREPAVVDGTVYVGSKHNKVYAVDVETGDQQWVFETENSPSSPAVAGDTVYVGDRNKIYAVDTNTGEQQWTSHLGWTVESGIMEGDPIVGDNTVYVGDTDGNLYAIDSATGTHQWTFETGNERVYSPAIENGTIYIGSDDKGSFTGHNGRIYALDKTTGELRWDYEISNGIVSPIVVNQTVYFGSTGGLGDNSHQGSGLNTTTGEEELTFEVSGLGMVGLSVIADTIYITTYGNKLYAINRDTGKKKWEYNDGDGGVINWPTVTNKTVYISNGSGGLAAINTTNGKEKWNLNISERFESLPSPPVVAEETLFVGADDLYALRWLAP